MFNIKKVLVSIIILTALNVHSQNISEIQIEINDIKNLPYSIAGAKIELNEALASEYINYNIQNQQLSSIFNQFRVNKFMPAYTAAYRPDATEKINTELLSKLKKIYSVTCTNCDLELLKNAITNYANTESSGLGSVRIGHLFFTGHTPNDYSLQYAPVSTDSYFNEPGTWQWHLDKIDAKNAWDLSKCSTNVRIAVIDEGFDTNHPELIGKINSITSINTFQNHGTSTAQLAAGNTNNGTGLASIGYNAKLDLYAQSRYSLDDILNAAMNGSRIISNSYTKGVIFDQIDQEVINQATSLGAFVIFAAGNGLSGPIAIDPDIPQYPASYDNVFSVSGVWADDAHRYQGTPIAADNSTQCHNTKVDICAPSYHIWKAAYQTISPNTGNTYTHSYAWGDGTSFAAPIVAGTVALMLDVNPCLTPKEIEAILKQSADDISNVADNYKYAGKLGAGRLNAFKAVSLAKDWGKTDFTVRNGDNVYWANTNKFYKNIYVKSGGTLTLNATELYMGLNGRIIVEKGARLIVSNNSVISSHPESSYLSCYTNSYRWQGIQIEGQPKLDQNPTSNQGLINVSKSVIQDAIDAISTLGTDVNGNLVWSKTGGGIIMTHNATFTNNKRHIQIMSYHRPLVNGAELNNLSTFNNTYFETYETRFTNTNTPQKMFTNWDTKGIEVNACTFQNSNNGFNANKTLADRGTGIYTVDASMKIQNQLNGSASTPTVFYDLQIGIDDYHGINSPLNGHIIKKNLFVRNIYGIQQTNANSSKIYRNNFKLEFNSKYPTYTKAGYWGIQSGGFQISENLFENNSGYTSAEIGSAMKSSSANGNAKYALNTHNKSRIGGQAESNNKDLQYYCNIHNNSTFYGLALNANSFASLPSFGDCSPPQRYYRLNAFNTNSGDIINTLFGSPDYLVKSLTSNPDPIAPKSINMNYLTCANATDYGCSALEAPEPNGWVGIPTKKPIYDGKKSMVIGKKDLLNSGNTSALMGLISQGSIIPANDLYNALMQYSPYLSDAALINMLQTSQHLSEAQIVDILLINSPLTNSVNNALTYRSFSQDAIDHIAAQQTGTSARRNLEDEIAFESREVNELRFDLINYYLDASLNDSLHNYSDSTILLLQNETDEYSLKQLVSIYIHTGLLTLAANKLALINQTDNIENTHFVTLMNIYIDLKSNEKNVFQLSESQEALIRTIAASNTNVAYNAQAILNLVFNEYHVERPKYIVETGLGKTASAFHAEEKAKNNNAQALKVYPNPTTNVLNIEYVCNKEFTKNTLQISNIAGVHIKSIVLNSITGNETIDVSNLSSGVYFITLKSKNETISKQKFVIIK